jgi:TolB protein
MSGPGPITRRNTLCALPLALPAPLAWSAFFAVDARTRPIAILAFTDRSATSQYKGRELASLIASDLRSSGRFMVPDLRHYLDTRAEVDAAPRFDVWRARRIDYLVTGAFALQPDGREKLEFRLWDIVAALPRYGAQYFVASDQWARIPHIIADVIFEKLTGQAGGFDNGR